MSLGRVGRREWWEKEERLYVQCMGREVCGMLGMRDIISLPLSVTKAGGHPASPTCSPVPGHYLLIWRSANSESMQLLHTSAYCVSMLNTHTHNMYCTHIVYTYTQFCVLYCQLSCVLCVYSMCLKGYFVLQINEFCV